MGAVMKFERVEYLRLNARQKENFNCQKLGARLADYGFTVMRLTDDYNGADMVAWHVNGRDFLRIQVKGRCTIDHKYKGKDIWIAFRDGEDWYVYPHDVVVSLLTTTDVPGQLSVALTKSWSEKEGYSFPYLSKKLEAVLRPYRLP
jgi:hypothetical protein